MIKSMTGYGRSECTNTTRKITVEIKSLNSKQLDLSMRTPSIYREIENEIRTLISRTMGRGKVDFSISYENLEGAISSTINHAKFIAYYNELSALCAQVDRSTDHEPLVSAVLRMPEVVDTQRIEVSKEELDMVLRAASQALEAIDGFRAQEGAVLIADLVARVDTIEGLMHSVEPFEHERIDTVRERIIDNFNKLSLNVDNDRLEQEMIFYLEKYDFTEEKVRLGQHCNYFREQARSEASESIGRKLGFIAQEMGREINTLGSKANHQQIQRTVVEMKDELEKIKEQLLNIL
ncbi:MAG: YicC/YloC family endoribonuclease [Mucinivorans sp.]